MKTVSGLMACLGVFICFVAVGMLVLRLEYFAMIMAWGYFAVRASQMAEDWIKGTSKTEP